ncbi:hypothetical protein MWN41_09885 [Ornithobacterium rhinotracheale]|uniref:hypothetical protein n=1 Tax=Ornithobacterium rhinotracheale TaxID=28251 RepID=UPI001FF3C29E|nr:hypothetical protein [Ornithobacterium rhinotracheale]MCK0203320.1 hypothetical protein [Ornithobacterium rhinotracheale]
MIPISDSEKALLIKFKEKNGVWHKDSILFHLNKNIDEYHRLINSLSTKGYIYEDRATFKITEKGYNYLNYNPFKTNLAKIITILAAIGTIISTIFFLIKEFNFL